MIGAAGLVEPKHDALALFGRLHRLELHDAACDVELAHRCAGARGRTHEHRRVQLVGAFEQVAPLPRAGVRVVAERELVLAEIGLGVGVLGAAQQRELHDPVADVVAVLRVVHEAQPVVRLREVGESLPGNLELRGVGECVRVRGPAHRAVLDLVGRLRGEHRRNRLYAQLHARFSPVHVVLDADEPGLRLEDDPLAHRRASHGQHLLDDGPQRSALQQTAVGESRLLRFGLAVVVADVPRVPAVGQVLPEEQPVRTVGERLASVLLVVDRADRPVTGEIDAHQRVLEPRLRAGDRSEPRARPSACFRRRVLPPQIRHLLRGRVHVRHHRAPRRARPC